MTQINIQVDSREVNSGIPEQLRSKGVQITLTSLSAGDYLVNGEILIERKTASDFIQSLIDNRLFDQCSRLKKWPGRILILIEGDPFSSGRNISEQAIRGTLNSIMVNWQIPVIYSLSKEDTVKFFLDLENQLKQKSEYVRLRKGIKPKRIKNQMLYFLQGLPSVGPQLAGRLILKFGNIKTVMNSDVDDLKKVEGIGKVKAKKIVNFISEIIHH